MDVRTRPEILDTDILIVGGGAAGCAAAVEAHERAPDLDVTVVEKAHISRSGCLAMGLNAINAYLHEGTTPEDYLVSVRRDAHGLVREDLVLSVGEDVNGATHRVEAWGLPIPRDPSGLPFPKGPRSIRILGESLKPLLARKVASSGARVINRHTLLDLRVSGGTVCGGTFLGVRSGRFLEVRARTVILATGGASGLYRTPLRGAAQNRMWYSPFNVGTGYAAALRAGAELTTLEMRFIPTRTHVTAAPTGTLVQTFGAREENVLGRGFHADYARAWQTEHLTTPQRLRALLEELKAGRGPVLLRLGGNGSENLEEVLGAYLDMTPAQVALWAAEGFDPARDAVEIGTSGPYLLGGHTASGLWVDVDRRATLLGLYAAGDAAGGAPKKYVSGAWAEGFRAARTAVHDIRTGQVDPCPPVASSKTPAALHRARLPLEDPGPLTPEDATERLQRVMDEYAGGLSTHYELHGRRLEIARRELEALEGDLGDLGVRDLHGLLLASELRDRVLTARALVAHLSGREETRWPGYQTRVEFPRTDPEWRCFLNSKIVAGKIRTLTRPADAHASARISTVGE